MAEDSTMGYKIVATIESVKGKCDAGHRAGETFEINCINLGRGSAASFIMIYFRLFLPFSSVGNALVEG